jgi:hypothetical protein
MELFFKIIYFGSVFSPLLTLGSGVYCILKKGSINKSIVFLLPVLSLISDGLIWIFSGYKMNAFILVHMYTLCAGMVYLYYFWSIRLFSKLFSGILATLFIALSIVTLSTKSGIAWVNIYSGIFLCLIGIIGSLNYFFRSIRELKYSRLSDDFHFWINVAILVYFGMTFFISLFEGYIRQMNQSNFIYTFIIMYIGNILYNSIISFGIWKTNRN